MIELNQIEIMIMINYQQFNNKFEIIYYSVMLCSVI